MYSYGSDPVCVGVDGIKTCMGIFLDTGAQLHAIHIPATASEHEGIDAFVRYVQATEPGFDRGTARLYGVMNTDQRDNGVELLRSCAQRLGVARWQAVKVEEYLRHGAGRSAAAIICRRVGGEIQLEYKLADSFDWRRDEPTTTRRAGFYRTDYYDQVYSTDVGPGTGWISINAANSTIEEPSGWWGYCSML